MKMMNFMEVASKSTTNAFRQLKAEGSNFFTPSRQFDVTISMAIGCGESGYHVAWKFNSTLVLYFAQQMSLSSQDWAMGQPHNPAIVPYIGMTHMYLKLH